MRAEREIFPFRLGPNPPAIRHRRMTAHGLTKSHAEFRDESALRVKYRSPRPLHHPLCALHGESGVPPRIKGSSALQPASRLFMRGITPPHLPRTGTRP